MLQQVEILLLTAFASFFSSSPVIGLITLGSVSFVLFAYQFVHRNRTVVPGVFAVALAFLAFLHFSDGKRVADFLIHMTLLMESGRGNAATLPGVLEPIFAFFVAPVPHRFFLEELLFVVLAGYAVAVITVSVAEYKKTGIVLGDLSLSALLGQQAKRPKRSDSNELGSADMANAEHLAQWTRSHGAGDTPLYLTEVRGSAGTIFRQAKLIFPSGERNRHVLMVAKTGGGKTTKFILPVLYNDCLDPERSTIVIDSKPEMWRKLAAMTRKYNPKKNIMLFNPLDVARSLSWNILGKIEDDTDCKLIANTIIMATDNPSAKSDSPFFRNNALSILNSIMVGLLHDPNETLSMPRIHELVQSGMKPLCDWLEQHPHAYRTSRTFVELARSGSQNADTIMSELSMRISAWDLSDVRATTSYNELDIERLISEPTLFIVELRESELEMLRPMANVIVVELLRFLTKRAEQCPGSKLPRPVGLVIDEFASALGRLPDIHVKLNTLRSRNVSIVAAIQSIAQVKANYGDDADSVLAGFSSKIFMPNLDITDAEWASKETGQMTIRFQTSSTGSNKKIIEVFASKNDSVQEQVQQRAVLTPDEIGRPADNIATFFLPNTPVFQAHITPFYKIPEMLRRINEFDAPDKELTLRESPIEVFEQLPAAGAAGGGGGAAPMGGGGGYVPGVVGENGLPPGVSDTRTWSDAEISTKLDEVRKQLDWDNTTGSARKWWEAFESENKHRLALVLRLAEELLIRKATITEFFLAYVYSNTDNIQANLHYLDYTRLKKEEEKKRREEADRGQAAA